MGKGIAAWLSPAAMYSVVSAGTKVSEFALGRWEGCKPLEITFVCHALACQHLHATRCDRVQLVALSIGPLCRHDITHSERLIGNV